MALRSVAACESRAAASSGRDLDTALGASGTLATAIRDGRRAVCATDAGATSGAWHDLLFQNGVAVAACLPLLSGSVPIGALIVGATGADHFQHDELDLLMAVANCLSVAAESLETERQRRLAEAKVRRQESLLASAEHIAGVGTWERDLASERLEWSAETLASSDSNRSHFAAPRGVARSGSCRRRPAVRRKLTASAKTRPARSVRILRPTVKSG